MHRAIADLEENPSQSVERPSGTRRRVEPWTEANEHSPPLSKRKLSALLVEDDAGDAYLVKDVVLESRLDVDVQRVETVREALKRHRFDFLLIDLGLPDASGVQAVEQLVESGSSTTAIVLSGASDLSVAVRTLGIGAQDYIEKSKLTTDVFDRTVRYSLERQRYLHQLEFLSGHDQLTGLTNRRAFTTRVSEATARAQLDNQTLAIVLLDLDRLRGVNDSLGQEAGNQLIIEVAERIRISVEEFWGNCLSKKLPRRSSRWRRVRRSSGTCRANR